MRISLEREASPGQWADPLAFASDLERPIFGNIVFSLSGLVAGGYRNLFDSSPGPANTYLESSSMAKRTQHFCGRT